MSQLSTSSKYRLVLVTPWFGPWPVWMPLTWESCRWNPDVDWLIFTDQKRTPEMPPNVKLVSYTVRAFFTDLFRRLRLEGNPDVLPTYKVCDFKATYGEAFPDLLAGYDFWGYCDLDQVWGNLRTFYTDDVLEKFDVLTSSRAYTNGQGTFFRNDPVVNRLFRRIPEAELELCDKHYRSMDEEVLDAAALAAEREGVVKVLRRRLHAAEIRRHWDERAEGLVRQETGSLDNYPRLNGPCYWEAGRVYHCASGTEFAYYHFMTAKKWYARRAWSYPYWSDCMSGMEMNLEDIVMRFKKGSGWAQWKHFFLTRFGCTTWHWVRNPVRNLMDVVKRKHPGLIPYYQKWRGIPIESGKAV
jgi:hypothetical protein